MLRDILGDILRDIKGHLREVNGLKVRRQLNQNYEIRSLYTTVRDILRDISRDI